MNAGPVVVGVDGGPDSIQALRWAAGYAETTGSPLIALAVYGIPVVYGPYAMAGWEDTTELEKATRARLAETVEQTVGDQASVELRVHQGHPAEILVQMSDEASLVVVGSRGRGGFAGMLLGSVSQHVIAHARCPVVVLPRLEHA